MRHKGCTLKLTKLRIAGFKTFVEPAEFLIEPGLTGIVGPNGCGKSNLVEALRWVSLPKSRFEHTDDGGRQGSDAQQRLRSARSIAYRARPCQVKHGFAPRYNRWRMAQESGEGAPR